MKKQAMMMALLSAGLIGQSVYAAPSSANIEWIGSVPGAFNGDEIGLTGQGGGDIQQGELNVEKDGAFSTRTLVNVEAHEMIDTSLLQDGSQLEPGPEMYAGDVDWSLINASVAHVAYDAENDITITMNGVDLVDGTQVTTTAGQHLVSFGAKSVPPSAGTVLPGDTVVVQATIMAEANAGSL
ncbi:hypothetical protein [Vibrio jasicida]|uniref:hypothetical protein n=1 Tax=Vibrio jasicida TaxID=766224 RepID=UPI000CE49E25|nr:hypothetical protein [Vibrio jasicida]